MTTLRVALAGAGFLAATRARCWRRVAGVDVQLVAVAASTPESAQAFARTHGVERAVGHWRELLSLDDVQLVDVCLPNHAHRAAVVGAAEAGKAVLCTKPLAAYVGQDLPDGSSDQEVAGRDRRTMAAVALADARAMVAAAERAGVPLLYGENWVHAPPIERAAGLLASSDGVLLEMRGEEAHSGSHAAYARSWRHAGGGALLRLGSHPIGAMVHLKRQEGLRRSGTPVRVEAVSAQTADPLAAAPAAATSLAVAERDTESWGCATLHFEDGSRGVVFGSDLALGGMSSQLELRASNARLQCRLSPHDLLSAYTSAEGTFRDAYIMEKVDGDAGWSTPLPDEDWSSGQQGLVQACAEAVAGGRPAACDGWLGLEVTRVLAAAYVAAAEGGSVRLDELDEG